MKHLGKSLFAIFIILVLTLSIAHFSMRTETAYTETIDCRVVDKYYYNAGSRGASYMYYVILHGQGTYAEFEDAVQVFRDEFYESIKIGDTVTCKVTYDESGIL